MLRGPRLGGGAPHPFFFFTGSSGGGGRNSDGGGGGRSLGGGGANELGGGGGMASGGGGGIEPPFVLPFVYPDILSREQSNIVLKSDLLGRANACKDTVECDKPGCRRLNVVGFPKLDELDEAAK